MDISKSYNINILILFEGIDPVYFNHLTGCKDAVISNIKPVRMKNTDNP